MPKNTPKPQLLDALAAADYLSVTLPFVRRLVRERRVPYTKVGRYGRFDPVDLDEFLAAGRVEARK